MIAPAGLSSLATVAIVGDGDITNHPGRRDLAVELGGGVIDSGWRLMTGGLGGVMEAACEGARQSSKWREGVIVGVLPGTDAGAANPFVDIAMPTGLAHGRNQIVASADAMIVVGGGAGTLSEMAFAWIHQRLIVALGCGGWSEKLADQRIDERVRHAGMPDDRVFGADSAAEAIKIVRERLEGYRAG